MSIGTRIKELRRGLNLTQEELARKINVTKGAIGNYEKEVSIPKPEIMYKLFSALDCDANYLYQDDIQSSPHMNEIYSVEEKRLINGYRCISKYGKKAVNSIIDIELERIRNDNYISVQTVCSIPFYPTRVSAGTGNFLDSDDYEMIDLTKEPPRGASFIVQVSGDSMEPTYCDGDKLFIKQQPSIDVGEIGIFMVDGDVFVKELGNDGLISHNKKYDKIKFTEYSNIRCYGRVIGICEE